MGRFASHGIDVRSRFFELNWLSPKRFILKEKIFMKTQSRDVIRNLGTFAQPDPEAADSRDFFDFSAEAECELVPGDRYRFVHLKPGADAP